MKLSYQPVAIAVSLGLASVAAHAQLPSAPGQNLTSAPTSTGLYLAVYDSGSNDSEIVNLSYDQSVLTAASGNLTPNAPNAYFKSAAAPTGSGTVLQLNFGEISGFQDGLFTSSNAATTGYMVFAAISGGAGTEGFETTSSGTPITAYSGVSGAISNIQSEIASWQAAAPTSGDLQDTTGTTTTSVQNGTLKSGQIITGQNFSGSLGSALNFYDITTTSGHKSVISPYANATGDGYWFLSTSGDLTYNVPYTNSSPVPLPPAVWLLGSGLLGMAGIARRRRATV